MLCEYPQSYHPIAQSFSLPLFLSATSLAAKYCRAAHATTSSGTITARIIIHTRRTNILPQLSLDAGMFGWIAIQIQADSVASELQIMFQRVRQVCISLQADEISVVTSVEFWDSRVCRMVGINMMWIHWQVLFTGCGQLSSPLVHTLHTSSFVLTV
jgi:hypothetical protein